MLFCFLLVNKVEGIVTELSGCVEDREGGNERINQKIKDKTRLSDFPCQTTRKHPSRLLFHEITDRSSLSAFFLLFFSISFFLIFFWLSPLRFASFLISI